jgi:hypothetical protein
VLLSACAPGDYTSLDIVLKPLQVHGEIPNSRSLMVTDVASLPDCSIVVGDAVGARIVELDHGGRYRRTLATLAGPQDVIRLETAGEKDLLVWAYRPPFMALVNRHTGTLREITLPPFPLGESRSGPVVMPDSATVAIVQAGDPRYPYIPRRTAQAPWLQIANTSGNVLAEVGRITAESYSLRAWGSARVALGAVGDTVIAVSLASAIVTRIRVGSGGGVTEVVDQRKLPRYYDRVVTNEEVARIEMVRFSPRAKPELVALLGYARELHDRPHLAGAHVGHDGALFVARNITHRWRRGRVDGISGTWVPEQAVELYDARGEQLGLFRTPFDRVHWIKSDSLGRLFIAGRTGNESSVLVARNPFAESRPCPWS